MDAPEVRYARAADGAPIAFRTLGSGQPAFWCVFSSVFDAEWRIDEARAFFEDLARGRLLIPVDPRGTGMSGGAETRDASVHARDLLAVADHLGQHRFSLVTAFEPQLPLAVHALAPGRLTRTAVFLPIADFARHTATTISPGFQQFGRLDVRAYGRLQADYTGLERSESRERFAEMIASRWTPETYAAWLESAGERTATVSALAPRFTPPLLAIHRRDAIIALEQSRNLVTSVPNGRLHVLEGAGLAPYGGDGQAVARAITAFLDEGAESAGAGHTASSAFRTILFTDVVASTPLLAQLGDARMREVMRNHDDVLSGAVTGHGGRVIKTIGDAFMAEFALPSAAVEAAITAQRAIRERFASSEVPVRIRIGINAGEPIEENGDLHGTAVVVAKRLESLAGDGGILVSDVVRHAVAGKDFDFEDRGYLELKGFDEPVRAWAVRWV